jgi:transcriptional regulator with XRE-family HTH domain
MTTTEMPKKIHHGRNIKRFRELFGIKQEALAIDLGPDWSQKKVSRLEENEVVEDEVLDQIAEILKVPVAAIKNFTEEAAVNYFNTFHEGSVSHLIAYNGTYNNNPIDKINELIKKTEDLYERLLAAEKEKVELLQRLLDQRK